MVLTVRSAPTATSVVVLRSARFTPVEFTRILKEVVWCLVTGGGQSDFDFALDDGGLERS
jgi:hypothetical protein